MRKKTDNLGILYLQREGVELVRMRTDTWGAYKREKEENEKED